MEEKTYRKIIEEISHYPVKRIMPYLMNEPLCDRKIVERINYAKAKNPKASVRILTNGINQTEKISEGLRNSLVDWIGISVHAIREDTYYRFTGRKDFSLILKRITQFIEKGLEKRGEEFILINLTHPPGFLTEEEKEEAIHYWKSLGVKRIAYFPSPISRAGNVPWLPQVRHRKIKGCRSIWRNSMIHILFNGDVVLCCMDWKREVVLGNVKRQTIEEIWNGEKYNQVERWIRGEEEPPENFLCLRCEEAEEG